MVDQCLLIISLGMTTPNAIYTWNYGGLTKQALEPLGFPQRIRSYQKMSDAKQQDISEHFFSASHPTIPLWLQIIPTISS